MMSMLSRADIDYTVGPSIQYLSTDKVRFYFDNIGEKLTDVRPIKADADNNL